MISIRRAEIVDIPNIMRFLDEHWKPGNIIATNREFFEWQFVEDETINMFIGIGDDGTIYGTMGYVPYNHSEHPDISGCVWRAIKCENPLLGMEITEYALKEINVRYSVASHLTKKSQRIYELKGGKPTSMDHYYRLNPKMDYKIACVVDPIVPNVEDKSDYRLIPITSIEEMRAVISDESLRTHVMSKDYRYIERRYFEHPVFHYEIWKIEYDNKKSDAVMITREVESQGSKIVKIIDYYGDIERFTRITDALDQLMQERGYEFIDVYSYGVSPVIYEKAGFVRCDEESENIIPNHFYPFEQKNVTLNMIEPSIDGLRMFRGDGDQDRPG